jgi:signal transduction histidine kinase
LEGVDRHWIETGNRDTSYSSLAPGDYSFKVSAINNDGVESLKPAEIRFRILPPFWHTWWFRVVSLVVLIAAAAMIVLFQIRRIKEKIANKERNKQLVMAQRMKLLGILAGGAVHDLKNLLGIIIGYSDLVVESGDEAEEVGKEEAIEVIKSTADTAFQVVKQMLAFTRPSADESTASDLSDLVEELLEILRATVPKTVKIRWEAPEEELLLYINPVKFKQVVLNLSLNAVQAMQDKGELTLSLSKDPAKAEQIVLEVSDTGAGMEQEIQDKIFNPLFTTKGQEKGAGLGLFVVKQVVDECGGKIRIRSKLGEGTTFTIRFPVKKSPLKKPIAN